VGDAAGVSQSAPYRHFADKRALLDAMVRQIIQQMGNSVQTALSEGASPIATLRRVVGEYYRFARSFPLRYRLLLEECRSGRPVGAEARHAFASIVDLVHVAQQSGELRDGDPELMVALIFGAIHGIADLEQFGLIKARPASESAAALPGLLVTMLTRETQPVIG
jgi:AcrR family transcriptional regulator